MKPLIGITVDRVEEAGEWSAGRYQIGPYVARAVATAGGVPVLLAVEAGLAEAYAQHLHGFVFSGGLDPDTRPFGEPMHPKARQMDPQRQAFEVALLDRLADACKPVLGICLGMQMMALHAGGRLDQYLPDTLPDASVHRGGTDHVLRVTVDDCVLSGAHAESHEPIYSSHQQAVADPGGLRTIAVADDGTIEAVDGRPRFGERFYVGVQWHPERGGSGPFNLGLFRRLVSAARDAR
ncbi:MAG: gamma-glutamyl-gamma-aminobutyrate hydrolase family protein [Phycisphaeraceae bacterium]